MRFIWIGIGLVTLGFLIQQAPFQIIPHLDSVDLSFFWTNVAYPLGSVAITLGSAFIGAGIVVRELSSE